MNVEFKVGDKACYIGISDGIFTRGKVYEVSGSDADYVEFIDNNGCESGYYTNLVCEFFKRIDEPQPPQVTKVKLTQEQARALENAMKDSDIEYVITAHAAAGEWVPDEKRALNELSVADLARALLIGYDVEQTAEEKVLEAWELNEPNKYENPLFFSGYRQGMKYVLDAYGIKAKGIND